MMARALAKLSERTEAFTIVLYETISVNLVLLHLFHPVICTSKVSTLHTGIQHCIVHGTCQFCPTILQGSEDGNSTLKIPLGCAIPNHVDMLRDVGRGSIKDTFSHGLLATFH